ncbi:recombinase family protein [Actinomadura barringtoniae]|uniref:Recombinase family protein n=1 Tax=Actinomadura barringtoniae TaxID=1427535 RepID=A0A939PFM9_9ACTN|nr:recombinase family protein [Actinomadura barringtoniae]MBO2451655.1 recombinase family protein [Actinomadura barringtoniae]
MTTRFAFYGRVSTEDNQDPEASRAWQLSRARALIEPHGGEIVMQFFDVDKSRSMPWPRRPYAAALIEELKDSARAFDAVVIGEPHRAFYGNQYSLTFPLFEHFRIALWVPEVGGPIDGANEAHDMIMGVFGGLSKGERNRIKIRVRAAMRAITATEGRWLGGRPPYGYELEDVGPHPNPAKAAEGKRLKRLVAHPVFSRVVKWIFAQYLAGKGRKDIAEELTRQGIPSPSASDPGRNRHRNQIAWSKSAVKVILENPRYTGYQVWNRQRKDEVLIDVNDVALGYTTKMSWNSRDEWIWSEEQAHDELVSLADYERAQEIRASRARGKYSKKGNPTRRPYAFRGCIRCGYCDRKLQGNWNNKQAYYRCRFPQEYALVNEIDHPKVVYLREAEVLDDLDGWLATAFAPSRIAATIDALAEQETDPAEAAAAEIRKQLATCDRQLKQYRGALDAGADPMEVTQWINEVKEKRARIEGQLRSGRRGDRIAKEEIIELLERSADLAQTVIKADPLEKADLYQQLGLKMTYYPQKQLVEARVIPEPPHVRSGCVRGGTETVTPNMIMLSGTLSFLAAT